MLQATREFAVMGKTVHILESYPEWLLQTLAEGKGAHVVTLNSEMIMQARSAPQLSEIIDQAELVIPDGAGVVLYLRLYGIRVQRVPGIELSEVLLTQAAKAVPPLPVYFYGGAPGVAKTAAEKWQQKLPSLAIAGVQHGFLAESEEKVLLDQLATHQPKLIFVGLGVPRQEYWIAQHRHLCPRAIWVGIGGSFDIWADKKSRAPRWLRDNNLEWVYRLYQEPWRWRRMLVLPQFAWQAVLTRLFHHQS
jgi:N-acetylglucosaminyldiphosphoundecaprenol N-acetyl-beta-D-mannosaminyltransferase